jgi:dihydroorotase
MASVSLPGLVDIHVHFRDPGFTHKEDLRSGAAAAFAGGFSAVCCMPNTAPACDSAEVVRGMIQRASGCSVQIYPIAAVTLGQRGETLTDFAALKNAGTVAFSDDGIPIADPALMRRALVLAADTGLPLISHCEPEDEMTERDIRLAAETGCPIHFAHVSTAKSAALIREAKARGVRVTAETCPHYLLLTAGDVHGSTNRKMNPPLRMEADRLALIEAIVDGTLDILCTDHAPHAPAEKDVPFDAAPNGVIGLETALAACWTALRGRVSLRRIVEMMSSAPARLLRLPPPPENRFRFDPDAEWTVRAEAMLSKSRNTPFEGMTLQGRITHVL